MNLSLITKPSFSFFLLVLHQSSISLIKHSRLQSNIHLDLYNPPTAIFLTELLKAIISLTILIHSNNQHHSNPAILQPDHIQHALQMTFPALLYTLQNHLLYISLSELDTPIYLITSQLKILTTALSSVLICKKVLVIQQWICLSILALGVILVQFEPIQIKHHQDQDQRLFKLRPNQLKGFLALSISCLASGLAGSYFERSLKLKLKPSNTLNKQEDHHHHPTTNRQLKTLVPPSTSSPLVTNQRAQDTTREPNLWTRNLQLSVPSLIISYLSIYLEPQSRQHVLTHGFFYGFLPSVCPHPRSDCVTSSQIGLVWLIILYHSVGGLLVSIIVKQSGSLAKNFATCFSILLSVLLSAFSNQTHLGFNFYLGGLLVLFSIKSFTSFVH